MRRLRLILLAAAVAAAFTATVAPAPAGASVYKRCRGSYGISGDPGGGVFRGIQVRHVTCPTGKRVVRKWIRTKEYLPYKRRFRVAGFHWSCVTRYRRLSHSRFQRGYVTCAARGLRRVKFYFGVG